MRTKECYIFNELPAVKGSDKRPLVFRDFWVILRDLINLFSHTVNKYYLMLRISSSQSLVSSSLIIFFIQLLLFSRSMQFEFNGTRWFDFISELPRILSSKRRLQYHHNNRRKTNQNQVSCVWCWKWGVSLLIGRSHYLHVFTFTWLS